MANTGLRLGLGDLFAAGARGVSRYTGTLLGVFLAQMLVAAACIIPISIVLAQTFAHLPMFDEAVDGDLIALIWSLRHGHVAWLAIGGIVFGAIVVWQLASFFLVGGLYGVLAQRPESRGDTARCFGASGAQTYLAYARLALCSLPGWVLVLFVFGLGMGYVGARLETMLTMSELIGPLAIALVPTFLLLHFFWTVADYARVELTLRHDSHDPGVIATYFRSLLYVTRRPLTLVHAGFGWMLFILITAAYAFLAQGHPMYGVEGAITLFAVRQGVSLLRMAVHVGVMTGQVELGRTRPLPPRRVEVKAEAPSER
jgi:hypothetical protein